MRKREDLTGRNFNKLTFRTFDKIENHVTYWFCECDCGTIFSVNSQSVIRGLTKSCGCIRFEDLSDTVFNDLTCVKISHTNKNHTYWLCKCICGKETIVEQSHLKNGHTKSCGCSRNGDLVGKTFGWLYVRELESIKRKYYKHWLCVCDCGNTVIVSSTNLLTGNTTSCGCYQKEEALKRRGKNHPNWDDTITDEERKERENNRISCPKLPKWRKAVFKRDNYTCQCCKLRGGKLSAHHIYAWKTHKHLRYTVSNGITLCTKCHIMYHRLFGFKNSTRKKLSAFLRKTRFISV